jgi:hypothetical protein
MAKIIIKGANINNQDEEKYIDDFLDTGRQESSRLLVKFGANSSY